MTRLRLCGEEGFDILAAGLLIGRKEMHDCVDVRARAAQRLEYTEPLRAATTAVLFGRARRPDAIRRVDKARFATARVCEKVY